MKSNFLDLSIPNLEHNSSSLFILINCNSLNPLDNSKSI